MFCRQGMIQYIVQKLSPLLAEIISKIDTNQNLDLMDESAESWKRRLWLKILNCPGATKNTHSMFDFRHVTAVSPEFVVLGTRSDNHMFSAKFPFSWIISELVQNVIQQEGSTGREGERKCFKFILKKLCCKMFVLPWWLAVSTLAAHYLTKWPRRTYNSNKANVFVLDQSYFFTTGSYNFKSYCKVCTNT